MNDPLKKYIDENRDEFDHLIPSDHIFSKIKQDLNHKPVQKKTNIRLLFNQKWMAAAAIVVIVSTGILIFNHEKTKIQDTPPPKQAKNIAQPLVLPEKSENPIQFAANTSKINAKKKATTQINQTNPSDIYAGLADSTSSNTRLSAILNLQKSNVISYDAIDRLTATLNHDSNSNVRLAALNLLSRYATDSHVANNLLQSFGNQTDPVVQMGMMELLRGIDNPILDQRLYALANDPNTLAAVKDQAYFILLNQNKL